MGKIVGKNLPCLDQVVCKSSDARQLYEDGGSYCFSCKTTFRKDKSKSAAGTQNEYADEGYDISNTTVEEMSLPAPEVAQAMSDASSKVEGFKTVPMDGNALSAKEKDRNLVEVIKGKESRGFRDRDITLPVSEFFGVKVDYDAAGNISAHYYPYGTDESRAYKKRALPKAFSFIGKFGGLFGVEKFAAGGKRIVITEGEIDAMSVAQAYLSKHDRIYPVVSVPSASSVKELIPFRDFLRSFGEIVLAFDNDEAGELATKDAIHILGYDKCKIVSYPDGLKDFSDVYRAKGMHAVTDAIWSATARCPAGIIDTEELKRQTMAHKSRPSIPYPPGFDILQAKTKGRRRGEIALYVSGTGCGKSTIVRALELFDRNILQDGEKIGAIHLEETPGETGVKVSCLHLGKNPAHEDVVVTDEELSKSFDEVFGKDQYVVLDHQAAITDDSIIDKLEYMCLVGCTHIYLDHLTILVSEGMEGLTGNEAQDKMMNALLRIVKKYNIHLGLVAHLRKNQFSNKSFEQGVMPTIDDIKGSGAIKQVCMDIIAFARDTTHENETVRNTIELALLKCRETGNTGPAGKVMFNRATGRISAASSESFQDVSASKPTESKPADNSKFVRNPGTSNLSAPAIDTIDALTLQPISSQPADLTGSPSADDSGSALTILSAETAPDSVVPASKLAFPKFSIPGA